MCIQAAAMMRAEFESLAQDVYTESFEECLLVCVCVCLCVCVCQAGAACLTGRSRAACSSLVTRSPEVEDALPPPLFVCATGAK